MKFYHTKSKGNHLLRNVFFMLFSLSFVFIGCDDDDDDNGNAPSGSIVKLVQDNSDLSTLESALTKFPDLVTALSSTTSEYTVFAPDNAAFTALLSAIGQTSLDDIPEDVLREVLEYHVIASAESSFFSTHGRTRDYCKW